MKETELRVISELMKNSRRSDRELAKAIGVSQPTIGRTIAKLEKEGVIREYTITPDFCKLGFNLMAVIMFKLKPVSPTELQQLFKASHELDNQECRPYLLVMNGMGMGKDLIVISFHKDYGDYCAYLRNVKEAAVSKMKAYVNTESIEGFLIDLDNKDHYQPLTYSRIVAHLQSIESKKNEEERS
jgi:DNA-binding Lrp family transcriptional regulator